MAVKLAMQASQTTLISHLASIVTDQALGQNFGRLGFQPRMKLLEDRFIGATK